MFLAAAPVGWALLALLWAAAGGALLLTRRAVARRTQALLAETRANAAAAGDRERKAASEAVEERRASWRRERQAAATARSDRDERLLRLIEGAEAREATITGREAGSADAASELACREEAHATMRAEAARVRIEQRDALLARAGLGDAEARQACLRACEAAVRHEEESRAERAFRELEEDAEYRARDVLHRVLHRIRTRQTLEPQQNVIQPRPGVLERWLVREPALLKRLQELTGVEVTREADGEVRFSAYDGVAREVAKLVMLESERRPQLAPETLEAVVREQEESLARALARIARRLLESTGLKDLHPDIVRALGRLRFRTSYGQNILEHSIEAGFIAGILGAEVGLDGRLAMRCGLLHDLGKALTTAEGGMHDDLGAELARRCGEPEPVVEAIEGHHHDHASVYTRLAMSGDAISGARPGARRETYEKYVERIEQLTAIASSFPEVQGVFTMKAGREVRVQARPSGMPDEEVSALAARIAERIEKEVVYPGEIHVTAIKETKVVEVAH